jgi:hypothetical protein
MRMSTCMLPARLARHMATQSAARPKISHELPDRLVPGPLTAEATLDAWIAFKKMLIPRAPSGELIDPDIGLV